jgi:hypothetical protein
MSFDVLLEILRTLERFATEIALVRLERDVDANVRSDVIALDRGRVAVTPAAGEVQVVRRLATDVLFADVFLEGQLASWSMAILPSAPPLT